MEVRSETKGLVGPKIEPKPWRRPLEGFLEDLIWSSRTGSVDLNVVGIDTKSERVRRMH